MLLCLINFLQAYAVDDSGTAISGTSTATVAITVSDVNDNVPVLRNPHPTPFQILEVKCTVYRAN